MNFSDYINSRDMFDGGGAGKSGAEFEDGGILSFIANLLAKPLGSRQNEQPTQATGASDIVPLIRPMTKPVPTPSPTGGMSPLQAFGGQPPAPYSPAQSPFEAFGGQPPAPYQPEPQYSGRGHAGMPMPSYAQSDTERQTIQYLRSLGYRL